jgi:osmotically-inducible protein OsmY
MQEPNGRGPHAGKGPRGYRRSDERVREDVGDALERHGEIDASDIELHVAEGVVTLTGLVEDRRMLALAVQVVEAVPGVKRVDNQMRVSQGRLDNVLNDFSATGTSTGSDPDRTR